ncbi:MAG: hypothetical protein DWQ07_18055 [Chloroflexi bacterium]|nr:MAG: hypothetical protein DWQ07_18055 [Chloroflexota bacterium]
MRENIIQAKGWVAVVTGFIACPCHLPFTLPLALTLTAGTALGAWIASNTFLIGAVLTVYFLGALGIGWYWLTKEDQPVQKNVTQGKKNVVVLTSSACSSCEDTVSLWNRLKEQHNFKLKIVDVNSRAGRQFAGAHNIFSTPVTLINQQVVFRGLPDAKLAAQSITNKRR